MERKRFKQLLIICLSTVLFYVLLSNFGAIAGFLNRLLNVFSPVLWGILLAVTINVPLRFFENKVFRRLKAGGRTKRVLALLCTYVALLAVAGAIVGIIVPQFEQSISLLVSRFPEYTEKFNDFVSELRRNTGLTGELLNSIIAAAEDALASISQYVSLAAEKVLNFTINFASGVFNMVLALILSVYILSAKEKLKGYAAKATKAFLPEKINDYLYEVMELANEKFSSFIAGQAFEGALLGTLCGIGMLLIGLPYPLLISVIIGATALIPVIGPWVGTIVSALLILFESPLQALIFVIYLLLLQQLDNHLIYPRVMGNAVGLDGLWIIVAVTVGGALGGALGMLLAVPAMSVLWIFAARIVQKRIDTKDRVKNEKHPDK